MTKKSYFISIFPEILKQLKLNTKKALINKIVDFEKQILYLS